MNYVNAQLSLMVGTYVSNVVVHAVGLLCVAPFCIRGMKRPVRVPWWQYTGGIIGVMVVILCMLSITALGVTAALVLALVGQTVISLIMDQTGFMGSIKKRIDMRRIVSAVFIVLGAGVMLLW